MKKFKGTPGKWIAEESPVTKYFWSVSSGDTDITYLTLNQAEVEANAKLIATAPELLEALQDLVGRFCAFTPLEIESLNNAKQVINKAIS